MLPQAPWERMDIIIWVQGCALRKIEGTPVLWTCKIQGAQHVIFMKNLRFSSRPRAKVRRQGPPGFARAQPCSGKTNWDLSLPQLSVISELPVSCDHKKIWWTEHGLQKVYWKKIWVRGLGKVCLWLFLLSSTAENTVTLTNFCETGYMVHRNQLQPCILCS